MQRKLYEKPKMEVAVLEGEVFLFISFEGGDNMAKPGLNWGGSLPDPSQREWTGWY